MNTPRIRMPARARPNEPVEVRTLIDHPMETGLRQDGGRAAPRRMIVRFEAWAGGDLLLAADLRNGTSANPFISFFLRFERTSEVTFVWREEDGREHRATHTITVA